MLASDLDMLEEVLQGFDGPVKIQLCGPWTLAATLELTRTMNVALSDPGAVADLTASLAEAAAAYAADVARRVPGGKLVVQFDEPLLPSVVEGLVPTQSGLSRLAPVEADTVRDRLSQVLLSTPGYRVVHCCAATVPFGIIQKAGADGIAFDLSQLRRGGRGRGGRGGRSGAGVADGGDPGCGGPRGRSPADGPRGRSPADGRAQRGARDGRAGHPAVAAAGPAVDDGRGPGGDHAGLRPGRGVPGAGSRRADPVPGGGRHAAGTDRGDGGRGR